MVRTVCVAIFSQCDVLVSMHDFNLPMISIEPQNGFWCGRCHAGYQIGDLRFAFRDLAFADMAATTGDTRNAGDCRPSTPSTKLRETQRTTNQLGNIDVPDELSLKVDGAVNGFWPGVDCVGFADTTRDRGRDSVFAVCKSQTSSLMPILLRPLRFI